MLGGCCGAVSEQPAAHGPLGPPSSRGQTRSPPVGIEPISILGLILVIGLSLLFLGILGYALIKWYQREQCWHRPNFVFSLYHIRGLKSVEVELAPPFTVSGSMSDMGSGYMRFHDGGRRC